MEEGESTPPVWTKSTGNIILNVNKDLTRKTRWVKDGHRTGDLESSSYSGVVSRDIIWIAIKNAAFQGVNVLASDIQNAHLKYLLSEKHFIICGLEFGLEHQGKLAMIV